MSEEVQWSLTVNTELTYSEVRKLETVLMRVLGYLRQFSGNENLNETIMLIQRTITAIHSLQMAIRALQMASGPVGWAYAATSVVAAGLSGYSIYESMIGV